MKLGFAPITWNNEDLRDELGPAVLFETVLDEIAAAGYVATELGDGFPRDPSVVRQELDARGLALPSAWCGLGLLDVEASVDLEQARALCGFLTEVGAEFINLAHQGTPERRSFAGRAAEAPLLSARQWDALAERVCAAAEIARSHGLQPAFHLHAGTWVETLAELGQLLERCPAPLLRLCWDVGHALYGGVDPIAVVRRFPERIAYIHLKDVDGSVLTDLRSAKKGFEDGVRARVFTEVGRGLLDVPGLLAALSDIGYDGWLMVEQDSSWLAPAESARVSRAYLRSLGL